MSVLLPLFLLLLLFPGKRKLVGITLLFIVMTSGIQCENNEELADQENVVEHSSVITSLEPGTTYFWRIEAINNESAPFTTITGVHNFRTKTW